MTIFGPDVSKWQAGVTPAGLGFGFGMARASIGENVDPTIDDAIRLAKNARMPFAGYHFPYEVSKHSASAQAATWDRAVGGDKTIPCMIDWESDGSEVPTWDDAVKVTKAIQALGYKVTLLYTGTWYWQQQGSPNMSVLNDLGIALIISNYGSNSKGDAASIYAGRGGDDASFWRTSVGGVYPTFWQFGSQVHIGTYNGSPYYGDCNAFRGTTDQLGDYFTVDGTPPPPPPPPPDGDTYVVQPNDSWWSIAEDHGMSMDELIALNPPATVDTVLHPGDVVNVAGDPPKPPPSGGTYTVKSNDSWWSISEAYGITMDQLVAMNPPKTIDTVLHPGDVLNVPSGGGGGNTYTVKSNDSWWSISEAYGISMDALIAMNPPSTVNTVLHPGDKVNVP